MKILAIDLGKFNSVACSFDTRTNPSEFETIATQRWDLEQLLNQNRGKQSPHRVQSSSPKLHRVGLLAFPHTNYLER
jgi:transposase